MSRLRLGFAGTPVFAARILEQLLDHGLKPVQVYCQPDRPAGRGRKIRPGAVKRLAENAGIAVAQPQSLRAAAAEASIRALDLDVLVVAAYGLILPPAILDAPRYGCLNVHASLLPRWRGAAPVERALMAGDSFTGVSIMQMDAGLDTGPVLATRQRPILDTDTGASLEADLAELGATALIDVLKRLPNGLTPVAQDDAQSSNAPKLTTRDANVDWSRAAVVTARQVRALCERMPARSVLDGVVVRILAAQPRQLETPDAPGTIVSGGSVSQNAVAATKARSDIQVATGEGILAIDRLQINRGKGRPMSAVDAINGHPLLFAPGARFEPAIPDAEG